MRAKNSEPWRPSTNKSCIMIILIIPTWISAVPQNNKELGSMKASSPTRKVTEVEVWFMTPMNGLYKFTRNPEVQLYKLRDFV